MRGRMHTREFKLEVCREIASGEKRPAQICRQHELASSRLTRVRDGRLNCHESTNAATD
jgi:transposase